MSARTRGELREVRAARGAGGGRGGRPLPVPGSGRATQAAGVPAPGRAMRLPPGLLAGNARGGSCRAEWGGASRVGVRSGRGVPAPPPRPGPRGGSAGGVGSGTAIASGVTGTWAPRCKLYASRTRDKGLGAEGARSPCPRPACRLRSSLHPVPWSPRLLQLIAGGPGSRRHLASGTCATPRLAAVRVRAGRSLAAWPSARGERRLPCSAASDPCSSLAAEPNDREPRATAGATQPALLARGLGVWGSRAGGPAKKWEGTLDPKGGKLLRGEEARQNGDMQKAGTNWAYQGL